MANEKIVAGIRKGLRHARRKQRREFIRREKHATRRKRVSRIFQETSSARPHSKAMPAYPSERRKGRARVTAPQVFSVVENPDLMLPFYEQLRQFALSRTPVQLDMSPVTTLGLDAIVYLLWQLESFKQAGHQLAVGGNVPNDARAHKLLAASGFFKYVHASHDADQRSDGTLSVKSDRLVLSPVAFDVVSFARKHLSEERSARSMAVYTMMIELMANTHEHAYTASATFPRWYVAAHKHDSDNRVTMTFLDGGYGIPRTINKRFGEQITSLMAVAVPSVIKPQDSYLIQSALDGQFRTRTKEGFRGKGLPGIYDSSNKGNISNLVIISNRGYVNCPKNERSELPYSFRGTLFSWDFVSAQGGTE